MADKPQTRYIDADKLITSIYSAIPNVSYCYSSDPIAQAVNQQTSNAIQSAFSYFISNLVAAIHNAATPYENDKCMLCKQRDWDIVPDCAKE